MGQFWTLSFAFLCSFSAFLTQAMTNETQTYIIGVQNDLKPSEFSDAEEWYSSTLQTLDSGRGCKDLLHVYRTVFHGFSAKLTKQQALQLKRRPEILGVLPARVRRIQTTRSPHFLGLVSGSASAPKDLLTMSDFGSNIVIGVIDTGVWPEHPSFRDQGLDSIPFHWKGECVEGEKFSKSLCNKKLVGARYFTKGYNDNDTPDPRGLKSARDTDGHGSHTASIAGGMHVENASFLGLAQGVAVGIAPKARIAVYKVCWKLGCDESDIIAGFDKAVDDRVDVISLSISSFPLPYDEDIIAIGSFGAMEKGVIVSSGAGNSGPDRRSVSNVAPWMTSVGASTIDRNFPADIILGDGRVITGSSLYKGDPLPKDKYFPLIYAGNASYHNTSEAAHCSQISLDSKLVHGKIVMCEGDVPDFHMLKKAGGIGFVLTNLPQEGEDLLPDAYLLPCLIISQSAGNTLRNYTITSKNPKAKLIFQGTRVGVKPAPVVAFFSSRGPNPISNYILKPDLIAPGVNILAAWSPDSPPTSIPDDKRRTDFNIVSGTSMACPHVSGISALLKGAHPDWSPAMIRSALMTTAYTVDSDRKPLLEGVSYKNATVWDMGAGHVNPDKANDPGLVYDLTVDDYVDFLCASGYNQKKIKLITRRTVNCKGKVRKPWNLNYPAISVVFNVSESSSKSEVLVSRTATQVTDGASNYTVKIVNPEGVTVTVHPRQLKFKEKGEKRSYLVRISIKKMDVQQETTAVGKLTWADGEHKVTSPIIVVSKLSEK